MKSGYSNKVRKLVFSMLAMAALAGSTVGSGSAFAGTLSTCQYWSASEQWLDGEQVTIARTEISGGSIFGLVLSNHEIRLRMQGHNWDLDTGQVANIRVVIDGVAYTGTAVAVNDSEFEVRDLPREFVLGLMRGLEAVVEINGVRWRLNLYGVTACLGVALDRYMRSTGLR